MIKLSTYILDFNEPAGAYIAVVAHDKLEAVRLVRSHPLGKEIPAAVSPKFAGWVANNVTGIELELGYVHTIWDGEY